MIYLNILNALTVSFDQYNLSLLNKSINFFKKILMTPLELLKCSVFIKKVNTINA